MGALKYLPKPIKVVSSVYRTAKLEDIVSAQVSERIVGLSFVRSESLLTNVSREIHFAQY
jgi:hypothetical protein